MVFNSFGKKNGYSYKYRKNGKLLLKEKYINNIRNGETCFYFTDGKTISKKVYYKNGLKDGLYILYSKKNDIIFQCNFYKNIRHGPYFEYIKNIIMRGFYYFGQPTYYIYYIDGVFWKIKFLYHGRSTGIWGNILKKHKRKFIL